MSNDHEPLSEYPDLDDDDEDDEENEEDEEMKTQEQVITELKIKLKQRETALQVMYSRNTKQRMDNENLVNVVSSGNMNITGGKSRTDLMKRK